MLQLSVGGTTLLATLAASASYIAVPAAMRLSVPEADPTLSLAASLGVTFPFNILLGIPLYHRLAEHVDRLGGGDAPWTWNTASCSPSSPKRRSSTNSSARSSASVHTATPSPTLVGREVAASVTHGWDLSANIRIEVLCTADTAHAIAAALKARFYVNYAMILFIGDVEVLRPEKF